MSMSGSRTRLVVPALLMRPSTRPKRSRDPARPAPSSSSGSATSRSRRWTRAAPAWRPRVPTRAARSAATTSAPSRGQQLGLGGALAAGGAGHDDHLAGDAPTHSVTSPAVDAQRLPGDRGGVVGDEVGDRGGDVLGHQRAVDRLLLADARELSGRHVLPGPGRRRQAGRHRVDRHPPPAELDRQRAREACLLSACTRAGCDRSRGAISLSSVSAPRPRLLGPGPRAGGAYVCGIVPGDCWEITVTW